MSKFKIMVQNDIDLCDEYIEKGFATREEVSILVGKYMMYNKNFSDGIINYVGIAGTETNEIKNIKIIKGKLEYLLNTRDTQNTNNTRNKPEINISTINNNSNNNSNNIELNMNINNVRDKIKENTYISNDEKNELLLKLDEIKKLQESNDTRTKKWQKAKEIFEFILNKGVDIAIMYIPQILKAIER